MWNLLSSVTHSSLFRCMYSISYEHFLFFLLQTGAVKLKKSPDTPSSNCDTSSEGSNSKNDIPPMKPVGKLITLQCCQLGVNFLRKKRKKLFWTFKCGRIKPFKVHQRRLCNGSCRGKDFLGGLFFLTNTFFSPLFFSRGINGTTFGITTNDSEEGKKAKTQRLSIHFKKKTFF